MGCIYIFNGHKFNSELELDTFLLEKKKHFDTLGDIVFSINALQSQVLNKLNTINKNSTQLQEKYRELLKNKPKYSEDGDIDVEDPPYIGVNRYLSNVVIDSKRLYPEFRDEEYWSRQYENWSKGIYTDVQEEVFGIQQGQVTLRQQLGKDKKGNPITNYDQMRKQIEYRWKTQANIGTAIHNILQLFFTKEHGIYGFEQDNVKEYILNKLEPKNKKYIHEQTLNETIKYAQELKKELESKLGHNNGEELLFLPEFVISSEATHPETGAAQTILGIIDLLVVDKSGKIHIIDYKTSIKSYGKFDAAKQLAYQYQMATYQRILNRQGINTSEGLLMVAPIQIAGFQLGDDDKYQYEGIKYDILVDVLNSKITEKHLSNIDVFLPPVINLTTSTENVIENVSKFMATHFPGYAYDKKLTKEQLIDWLTENKYLEKPESGIYEYKPYGSDQEPITATDEGDFVEKVLSYRNSLIPKRIRTTESIKILLKQAIKEETPYVDWPDSYNDRSGVSKTWLQNILSQYCNKRWEVIEDDIYESFGCIKLLNRDTGQVDIIQISTNMLMTNYRKSLDKNDPKRNRLSLSGTHEPDIVEQSKSGSMMLECVNGNVELMQTLAMINFTGGFNGVMIGNIQVINPYDATGISATNEELLYCFDILNKYSPVEKNRFESKEIQFVNKTKLAFYKALDIIALGEQAQWRDSYKTLAGLKTCTSIIDQAIISEDKEEQIHALNELLKQIESKNKSKYNKTYKDSSDLYEQDVLLYNMIVTAIAELKGINFRQQLRDHGQWFEDIAHLSATYLDNPGNLSSETLNLITKLITNAYQNTRDEMQKKKLQYQEHFDKYKKAKNFNKLKENLGFNQVDLYKHLFVETAEGDLLFKDLKQISDPADKEFLTFVLEEINKNRFPEWSQQIREQKRDSYNIEYYRVPLARGSADSIVSSKGLLTLLQDKLRKLNPKVAFQIAQEKLEGIYNAASESKGNQNIENLYSMTNLFDRGETTKSRLSYLNRDGNIHKVERNLEYLLLKHNFSYIQERNINEVFPMIKAASIHLQYQGAIRNIPFNDDLKYVDEYIRNKVLHQSIINPNLQKPMVVVNAIKSAASKLTLAFAPVQMFYQPLQGLWQDISLILRKPDGKDSFTFNHFKTSLKLVYSDIIKFSGKPTLCSSLNELYGINDMDMNTYIERITKTKKGIWNLENMMFKFASRPDFYNRMAIFLSQMQGEGCLEAHTMENGVLKYDWTKDKRFSKFAQNPTLITSDPEYNRQKSLYYTIAGQFVSEGARDLNGNLFKLDMTNPQPLPRAFTNKQAESMKSLSDDIYGYYSEEKKSLVMATAFGGMWLQFKTYWSGKKNQYFQSGGVRLRGSWEHYEENGEKYYYQVDGSGNTLFNKPPMKESEMIQNNLPLTSPVMQWKGQWQEGILHTMADIAHKTWNDPMHMIQHFKEKWNDPNDDLRRQYQNNMKQLLYDLIMFAVVGSMLSAALGDWLDELKEDNQDNDDFMTGVKLAAANVAVMSVKNSFLDFNFIESVGSPVGQWTPFAFEWAGRQLKNIMKVATGDEDIWDGVLNIAGASKQLRPIFDAVKPEQFRTKKEGGTWESATAIRNREEREK